MDCFDQAHNQGETRHFLPEIFRTSVKVSVRFLVVKYNNKLQ